MNQAPAANPSKLILQDRTPDILSEIEAAYAPDLILFDTPPLLVTDDTLAILKMVDAALIVAAAETTTVDQVDACEKEIAEQTNVMGVILNKCAYTGEAYGYDYNY
jgi:Mrp family chromosome partitioning ATPase